MSSFDETVELMAIELDQVEGSSILIAVTDDTVLREHAISVLRKRLPPGITLHDFRYDPEHLSLLEGSVGVTGSGDGRPAVSVTGLEVLPRDKRTEAIHLLNLQRNRFGHTGIAVILWVNRATLAEISNWSPDFYSWRSATWFVELPLDWNMLESMRRSYLEAVVAHNAFVNLQGLAPMRGGQIVQMRMEEIFIPLQAGHETKVSEAFDLRSRPPEGRDVWERYALQDRHEVKTKQVEIPELVQERRAVILGDPGAGKTTLLRYLAYTMAQAHIAKRQSDIIGQTPELVDCLPVYIRIGGVCSALQQHPEATLAAFAPLGCQMHQLPLTEELLEHAMTKGHTLLLLDGLDEIIDTGQRREVAQRIEQCALPHPQCRVLVTSRIVGSREVQIGKDFLPFTIIPFEDEEIRHFAQNWYEALGTPASAQTLLQAIQANPSIRRLAANPLLLTVIALIHWRGTKLPNHRVTLYRLASASHHL